MALPHTQLCYPPQRDEILIVLHWCGCRERVSGEPVFDDAAGDAGGDAFPGSSRAGQC